MPPPRDPVDDAASPVVRGLRTRQLRRPQPLGAPGWVARLERIRSVQRELGAAIAPYTTRLWELKGQQLRAIRDGSDAGPATIELQRLAGKMTTELDQFLHKRNVAFAEIDMPIDAARKLIQVAMDRFIDTHYASEISFEVPDEILQRFPESVRTFFRPEVRPPANR
jgi:hypothetical protein